MTDIIEPYSELLYVFTFDLREARGFSHGDRTQWKIEFWNDGELVEVREFTDFEESKNWASSKVFV